MITNNKASLGELASQNNSVSNYTKVYPPYGRKLERIRQAGEIPPMRVIVSTRWNLGKAYPRIVVTNEIPVRNLRFTYLAGLAVEIVYFNSDHFINDLIDAIRCVRPRNLALRNLDNVKAGLPTFKIIEPRHIKGAEHD